MVYLITYDLRTPGRDYTSFYDAIKSYGNWQHPTESTWFITSFTHRADGVYSHLSMFIDKKYDRLLVIEVNQTNKQGWLSKDFWNWLNSK